MIFGKKPAAKSGGQQPPAAPPPPPPAPPAPTGGGDDNRVVQNNDFPWAAWPDSTGCNFALGHISRNLRVPLMADGRLHAETYISAAGAAAGMAAHMSLLHDDAARARAAQVGMSIATTNDGREFLYGDAINNMLMANDAARAPTCVWNTMAGAAINAGLSPADIPDINELFGHVTRSLGGPREGLPSVEGHDPALPVAGLLQRVWPLVHDCLTGEIDPITKKNGFAAAQSSWAAVTAIAAGRVLGEVCAVMPPKIALTIGMESAVYASKLMFRQQQPQA